MKKKLFILIFIVITCMACIFGVTACGGDKPDKSEGGQGTVQTPPEEKPSEGNKPNENEKPSVVEVTGVTLNKTTLALEVDDVETLTASIAPNNATDKTVTWKSSDSSIAKVENGKVTAIKAGTATITAIAGSKSATCKVTVAEKVIPHTHELTLVLAKQADCETAGNIEYYKCLCGKFFFDANAENEITDKNVILIDQLEHTYDVNDVCSVCKYTKDQTEGLEYKLLPDNTYSVIGSGSAMFDKTIIVSTYYSGLPVTVIDRLVSESEKIVIPKSITNIADNAFWGNGNLRTINIPDSVTSIGTGAFANCISLIEINLPNSVTEIGGGVFYGCTKLTSVKLSENITALTDDRYYGFFENCKSLKSIAIHDNIEEIGWRTFDGCTSLESLSCSINKSSKFSSMKTIKNLILTGGKNIEYNITGFPELVSVTLPESLENIIPYAFRRCPKLESITVDSNNKTYTSINNCVIDNNGIVVIGCKGSIIPDIAVEIGESAFAGSGITAIDIPENIKAIGFNAFVACEDLNKVSIPQGITLIDGYTFNGCRSLKTVTIPDSIKEIRHYAFSGCPIEYLTAPAFALDYLDKTSLKTVNITSGQSIEANAFSECTNLTEIILADSITALGANAFSGCAALTEVAIPDSVTEIGSFAFYGCSSINNIVLSNKLNKVGEFAFYNCSSLASVTIPNTVTSIGNSAFSGCAFKKITTPAKFIKDIPTKENLEEVNITKGESIPAKAFENCRNLSAVNISDSIIFVGENAFKGCPIETATVSTLVAPFIKNLALKSLTITSGETIEANAFYGCTNLTEVNFCNGLISIGDGAFGNCYNLKSIHIPASVEEIGNGTFVCWDWGTTKKLTSITVEEENKKYHSINNCLIDNEGVLILGCSNSVIPDCIKVIGNGAFSDIYKTYLTIPDSVTTIENYAFHNCQLKNVNFGSGIKQIGGMAFAYNSFSRAELPSNTEIIGAYSFEGCRNLKDIILNEGLTDIGDEAFSGCSNLSVISIPSSLKNVGKDAFLGCLNISNIYAMDISSWLNISFATQGSNPCNSGGTLHFNDVIATEIVIPDGMTSIGSYAFYGCAGITEIAISNSVTHIATYAFYGCAGITEIAIPNSVTQIGAYAFGGCVGITEIAIPNSVTQIGAYAFGGCIGITEIIIPNSVVDIGKDAFIGCQFDKITIPVHAISSVKSANIKTVVLTSGDEIGYYAFANYGELTSVTIPVEVKSINDSAFMNCGELTDIYFDGTKEQWKAIKKGKNWNLETGYYTVHCSDGTLSKLQSME